MKLYSLLKELITLISLWLIVFSALWLVCALLGAPLNLQTWDSLWITIVAIFSFAFSVLVTNME